MRANTVNTVVDRAVDGDGPGPAKLRPDGRRVRAEANRNRIVAAVVALVGKGEMTPTAEAIAAEAGVSLRTVFRHFEEMENLYLEIAAAIFERAQPVIDRPFAAETWQEVVEEIVARRSEVFEMVAPYKRALDIFRHRSPALSAASERLAQLSRNVLKSRLAGRLPLTADQFEAIDLLTSLETWIRLRDIQCLSPQAASRVLRVAILAAGANAHP
jgi:AcrR family transcriptional regulator